MLTKEKVDDLVRHYQTDIRNVVREYIQHLFLSSLYQTKEAEALLFKGGTALRIVYNSPRFSEDVDFDGIHITSTKPIETAFVSAMSEIEKVGFQMSIAEAKKTSGGYLGILTYQAYGLNEQMKFEVSLRPRKQSKEVSTITCDFTPPYTITHVSGDDLVKGKIAALLDRNKPRDWYDLYFILRHNILRQHAKPADLNRAYKALKKTDINFKTEMAVLLPKSHHIILKDFKQNLLKELATYAK